MGNGSEFGITGLAVMGQNLARNLARHGIPVAVHNRTAARTRELIDGFGDEGPFTPTYSIEDLVGSLERPRRILIMVKAGPPVDAVIDEIAPHLDAGDVLIDGTPCCTYVGPDGAGHYLKMVHNGIEYADMQLIGEAYDLLRNALGLQAPELAEIFGRWNQGELESYLIEITARVLGHVDAATGRPLVDVIEDEAEQKGTGRWTAQSALELGVPITAITEAVFARMLSSRKDERVAAAKVLPGPGAERRAGEQFVDDVRDALYASKVIAYAQGFDQIATASEQYGWDVDLGAMATIWRGGCIIRARFLDRIRAAYEQDPRLRNLLLADYFRDVVAGVQPAWRRVVATAVEMGVPTPAFASSLAYYDGIRRERGPANLLQGLRDFFGAHTYHRTDRFGTFHTRWAQDGEEVEIES